MKYLRPLREALGLTQGELARKLEIDRCNLSLIESGHTEKVSPRIKNKILDFIKHMEPIIRSRSEILNKIYLDNNKDAKDRPF